MVGALTPIRLAASCTVRVGLSRTVLCIKHFLSDNSFNFNAKSNVEINYISSYFKCQYQFENIYK